MPVDTACVPPGCVNGRRFIVDFGGEEEMPEPPKMADQYLYDMGNGRMFTSSRELDHEEIVRTIKVLAHQMAREPWEP
jgi:hypothetical protein